MGPQGAGKLHTSIQVEAGRAYAFRRFTEGIHTTLILYQVRAVILHFGPAPNAGHYRAVLFDRECDCWRGWITDDNEPAREVDQLHTENMRRTCYVLWTQRIHA